MKDVIGFTPAHQSRAERRAQKTATRHLAQSMKEEADALVDEFPASTMRSLSGLRGRRNGRGRAFVAPPVHRASSRVLGGAYPFLAATGAPMRGAVVGEDLYSRRPYALDPWEAYSRSIVRSLGVAIIGTPGGGKSLWCKMWADRLMTLGYKVTIPADPKGEWVVVAEHVGGVVVKVGPGLPHRFNPLDAGPARPDLTADEEANVVLRSRRLVVKRVVQLLRAGVPLEPEEHTAIDLAIDRAARENPVPLIRHVLEALTHPDAEMSEMVDSPHRKRLMHTLRRITQGDLAGMFDGSSTVVFDTHAPIVVIDTSPLKYADPEAQALVALVTSHWSKLALSGPDRGRRVTIHEEAAIGLLNEVNSSDTGLNDLTAQQKLGRDDGHCNVYVFHRTSDLDALGDEGSAMRAQAIGLVQDTDMRIVFGQKNDAIDATRKLLGLNGTQANLTLSFDVGEALFLIGRTVAFVAGTPTEDELQFYNTDKYAGSRQENPS